MLPLFYIVLVMKGERSLNTKLIVCAVLFAASITSMLIMQNDTISFEICLFVLLPIMVSGSVVGAYLLASLMDKPLRFTQ